MFKHEFPTSIPKSQITVLGQLKGMANASIIDLGDGGQHGPGKVQFIGFVGALNIATGLYDGVCKFQGGDKMASRCDLSATVGSVEQRKDVGDGGLSNID